MRLIDADILKEDLTRFYDGEVTARQLIDAQPTVQPDHTADIGKKAEGDCISRQMAIDALDKRFDDVPMELTTEILQLRRDLRERIPSAQPATSCSEIPNSSTDCISRQAALDTIMGQPPEPHYPSWYAAQIEKLPAAQPEIIRCKDCKYMIDTGDDLMCDNAKGWVVATTSDFGCVLAERRTE